MSVNDARGPSIDLHTTKSKAKAKAKSRGSDDGQERLAHRACNTGKGAVAPVIPWAEHLFVVDPAPILAAVERLERKGGREVMARCPTRADADLAADWRVDRLPRLHPPPTVSTATAPAGGQPVPLPLPHPGRSAPPRPAVCRLDRE